MTSRLPFDDRRTRWAIFAIGVLLAYFYGAASYGLSLPPLKQIVELRNLIQYGVASTNVDKGHLTEAFMDVTGRSAVDCRWLDGPRTLVLFTSGQGNAGNRKADYEKNRAARGRVFNIWNGKCYEAVEPLLGSDGTGSSVWTRVAEDLLETGLVETVILVASSRGGSISGRWRSDGENYARLQRAMADLKTTGFAPNAFLWLHGESDVKTQPLQYRDNILSMFAGLRRDGMSAPIILSNTTKCQNNGSEGIRAAQQSLADAAAAIYLGPDTDTLTALDRYDGCVFNDQGKDKAARMWADSIVSVLHLNKIAAAPKP